MNLINSLINSLPLRKRETYPSTDELELKDKEQIEELQGKLASQKEEDKLMHSVLENDTETIEDGKLLSESYNQGVSSFTPDLIFQNMVQSYANAEKLYGKKLIRLLTGYDPGYVKKNIRIPEFCRELKEAIGANIKNLKKEDLLNKDGTISSKGLYLASLVLYTEELDKLAPKGFLGKKEHKEKTLYGDKYDSRAYRSHDRYRDINMKRTIKKSIRRGHSSISKDDLTISQRRSKGNIEIIYALDASGSMRGKKIETAKKAGIALAFKAIENRDKVGLIIFGSDVKEELAPTYDFRQLLLKITEIKASNETNISATVEKAIQLFSKAPCTKHLIIISDAMPTVGSDPEKDTLHVISQAASLGITTSLIGISLDEEGLSFAKRLTEISQGRLYIVSNLDMVDKIILEDYYETTS